jgi:hypothetical protein
MGKHDTISVAFVVEFSYNGLPIRECLLRRVHDLLQTVRAVVIDKQLTLLMSVFTAVQPRKLSISTLQV